MGQSSSIERMKNVLLVVLSLTTMLLLYFFWENPLLHTFNLSQIMVEEEAPVKAPSNVELLRPSDTIVQFGGGVYAKLDNNNRILWDQMIVGLSQFGQDENLIVEEITEEQFNQIMTYRSVRSVFPFSIPFGAFCSVYDIPIQQSLGQMDSFSQIGYSTGSPESLFLYNKEKDKYYRLVSEEAYLAMEGPMKEIEESGYNPSYSLGALIGSNNQTIVPLTFYSTMKPIPYTTEFDSVETDRTKNFAQTFFGESFDFIRRIEESKGTSIYMYGYGDKILTMAADGSVEYKEKGLSSSNQQDFFEALDVAIQFVAHHGGWEVEGGLNNPYLSDARFIETNRAHGYRFVFGWTVDDHRISYESGAPMVVEVFGNQVTYYTRNLIQIDPKDMPDSTGADETEAFSAVNMIAQNYEYLYNTLVKQNDVQENQNQENRFNVVSDQITSVKAGYLKEDDTIGGHSSLKPVWIVHISSKNVYFDLYTAEPVATSNE